MKKQLSLLILLFIGFSIYSQKIDSLQVLQANDWQTLQWFDKDTVYLQPRKKLDPAILALDEEAAYKKWNHEMYGERISVKENGTVLFTNHMSCPVGEPLKKVYSMVLKADKLIVDYETNPWPWEDNKAKRSKREFTIIRWSPEGIVLK